VNPRPTPGPARAWSFPPIHRAHLDNGVEVVTIPLPGKTLCAAELVLDAGAAFDEVEGVATLLARAFNEGTAQRDAAAFADASESLGMQLTAQASWDALTLSLTAPRSRLAAALDLMAEAAWTPSIPADGFDRIKKERLVQIEQEKANPAQRASIEFPRHAFTRDSVYSRSLRGTAGTVSTIDRAHLRTGHERYVSPGSATLVVAGGVDHAWVVEQAARAFGSFTRPEADRKAPTTTSAIDATRIVLVDRPGSVQTNLIIGHRGLARTDPDLDAIRVASYALGGSFSSRINQRLREELGLTYASRAGFETRRAAGPFQVSAPVQAETTAQAITETLQILRSFRDDGMTDEELVAAHDYLCGVFPLRFETTDAVATTVGELSVFGLPDTDLTTFPTRIAAVTREQASEAAKRILQPDAMLIIAVGPGDEIRADLEAIAPTTVVTD
jgi:predicted Zn-dependent peptidase